MKLSQSYIINICYFGEPYNTLEMTKRKKIMADEERKDVKEVIKDVEEMKDEVLDEVAGAIPNNVLCPPGQKRVGHKCVRNDE